MYKTIRSIHLLLASFCLPFLFMYGVSAVQMTHNTWFDMRPVVHDDRFSLAPGIGDARAVAREVMNQRAIVRGELTNVQTIPAGFAFRVVIPGIVHEVQYDRTSGATRLRTSVGGFMLMLNRLHHAAGISREPASLRAWALLVLLVSTALLLLGVTGLCMWFTRRAERRVGAALLAVNLVVAVVLLTMMRMAGP